MFGYLRLSVRAGREGRALIHRHWLDIPTYDGNRNVGHPDVLLVPEGFGGWRYWMAYTPFPPGNRYHAILATRDPYRLLYLESSDGASFRGSMDHLVPNSLTHGQDSHYRSTLVANPDPNDGFDHHLKDRPPAPDVQVGQCALAGGGM